MINTILLKSRNFSLSLGFKVFKSDISYPSNTILFISVSSEGFSASTTMDIDIKDIPTFCNQLQNVYTALKGEAKIQEPFGNNQYIAFSGDGKGRVLVHGTLDSNGESGFWQELKFENYIDQTFLPHFLRKLTAFSSQYIN